jgi:hypothetical protein
MAARIRCSDHATLNDPQQLVLTSPTSGGRSVGIVHSQTKATKLVQKRDLATRDGER